MLPSGFHFFERGWLSSNSLLIHDTEQAVLFDSGYVTHASQLLALLQLSLNTQPLDAVINTHLHSDHCGGNHVLQTNFEHLHIHVPGTQFKDALDWSDSSLTYDATGQSCPRFTPTMSLQTDAVLKICHTEWQVFSSPGHDNDSLIFFEPHFGILISADALWERGLGVIFPEFLGGVGFENVAKTYDLIESLKPKLIIPGHGPVFTDCSKALSDGRRKLAAFSSSPLMHATYSAKVLIKFKLMELHTVCVSDFTAWCLSSPLLILIHHHFFSHQEIKTWLQELFLELSSRGAMVISQDTFQNQ
jgi:glyoxylase-like metal-dependent hydrolase (beta-lactamase superfamily II)